MFAALFSIGIGYLHTYYVDIYDDDDSSGNNSLPPLPMPVEDSVHDINHNIFMTFNPLLEDKDIGKLVENSTKHSFSEREAYLSAFDLKHSNPKAKLIRNLWVDFS